MKDKMLDRTTVEKLHEKQRSAIDSLFAQSKARLRLYQLANDALNKAVNRANRLESNLESSRSAHRDCRDALKSALEAANAPDCKECDGTGDGFRFVSGGPTDEDQPEMVDKGGCEDCDGLGLEWL